MRVEPFEEIELESIFAFLSRYALSASVALFRAAGPRECASFRVGDVGATFVVKRVPVETHPTIAPLESTVVT
ncbi:MAG: hypothetical protein WCI05_16940 [Myxococcales bacterium]